MHDCPCNLSATTASFLNMQRGQGANSCTKQEASPDRGSLLLPENDVQNFFPLPPQHAAKARYPQSCTVLHCTTSNASSAGKCSVFLVQQIGIDFASVDRANCYKVGPKRRSTSSPQNTSTTSILQEHELIFAPRTFVWVTLDGMAGLEKQKGVILGASHDSENLESLSYTVKVSGESNQSIIYDSILPHALQYRPKEKHGNQASRRLKHTKPVGQPKPPPFAPKPPPFASLNIPCSSNQSTFSEALSEPSATAAASITAGISRATAAPSAAPAPAPAPTGRAVAKGLCVASRYIPGNHTSRTPYYPRETQ